MHSNPQPQQFIKHSITHNHTLQQLTNNAFICPKAIHNHHHIYHNNSYLIIVHKLYITYPRLTVQSHINCTRFTQFKSEPTDTISNSRLNLIGHHSQNSHPNKVHLISYPTLRTATKTDLRFKRYDRNRFRKFSPFKNSMYRYKTSLYRYIARMHRCQACLYRCITVQK